MTSRLTNGLKTTINDILLEEEANNEKLPDTFNLENIKNLFKNKWKSAFRSPLPLIQPSNHTLLLNNRDVLKELFDYDHPSQAFNFKAEIEIAFQSAWSSGSTSEIDAIQDCHSSVIRKPLIWWNSDNSYGLLINSDTAQKTMNSSSSISSKLASQSIECSVNDEKAVKIANLRPDLVLKDNFCRIFFKGKLIPCK